MKTYIALLRGINVSGQKMIKMATLKSMFEELEFKNVITYIQSGNVVFQTEKNSSEKLESIIAAKILKEFGWKVPVIVRTPEELKVVLNNNPFLADNDASRLYVTFLAEEPATEKLDKLKQVEHVPEEFIPAGKNLYFFSPNGYGRAVMNNNYFEARLGVSATTRNWKTVNKLFEIADTP